MVVARAALEVRPAAAGVGHRPAAAPSYLLLGLPAIAPAPAGRRSHHHHAALPLSPGNRAALVVCGTAAPSLSAQELAGLSSPWGAQRQEQQAEEQQPFNSRFALGARLGQVCVGCGVWVPSRARGQGGAGSGAGGGSGARPRETPAQLGALEGRCLAGGSSPGLDEPSACSHCPAHEPSSLPERTIPPVFLCCPPRRLAGQPRHRVCCRGAGHRAGGRRQSRAQAAVRRPRPARGAAKGGQLRPLRLFLLLLVRCLCLWRWVWGCARAGAHPPNCARRGVAACMLARNWRVCWGCFAPPTPAPPSTCCRVVVASLAVSTASPGWATPGRASIRITGCACGRVATQPPRRANPRSPADCWALEPCQALVARCCCSTPCIAPRKPTGPFSYASGGGKP